MLKKKTARPSLYLFIFFTTCNYVACVNKVFIYNLASVSLYKLRENILHHHQVRKFITINAKNLLQEFVCITHSIVVKGNQASNGSVDVFKKAFSTIFVNCGHSVFQYIDKRWHPRSKDLENLRDDVFKVRRE